MPEAIRYLVDANGERTSVLVPVKMWEALNENNRKLQRKLQILQGIRSALKEVDEAKRSGKKLQTLKEFLQ